MADGGRGLVVEKGAVAILFPDEFVQFPVFAGFPPGDEAADHVADRPPVEPGLEPRMPVAQAFDGPAEVAAGIEERIDLAVGAWAWIRATTCRASISVPGGCLDVDVVHFDPGTGSKERRHQASHQKVPAPDGGVAAAACPSPDAWPILASFLAGPSGSGAAEPAGAAHPSPAQDGQPGEQRGAGGGAGGQGLGFGLPALARRRRGSGLPWRCVRKSAACWMVWAEKNIDLEQGFPRHPNRGHCRSWPFQADAEGIHFEDQALEGSPPWGRCRRPPGRAVSAGRHRWPGEARRLSPGSGRSMTVE